ncbi:MAG: 4-hydroxy-tetrahydrodipicolinate reductase [Rhodospirillales bacterium CG15_BIG_FIL_POST_REV_8_21_14_020_66_15]|nr:MAG: 4-hydroxy-tetrahydrodipicolinate reductase [Rhodospirillales bacterium CG15_BIG_FIL_POST_REV_8_21_14_020_66_15]
MNIGITGCGGRMGRMLIQTVLATEGAELAGGTEQAGSPFIGQDLGLLVGSEPAGAAVMDDARALFEASDVVIDFTVPAATAAHAALAFDTATAMVVGTTGLTAEQQSAVRGASEKAAIVQAGNMSLGVNLLVGLAKQAAALLGPDYDIEIVEMHHKHKIDAPSGTALMLGRAAAEGRGLDHDAAAVLSREGHTGARPDGAIGYASLRGGDVVGDHTVIFAGPAERVELTHRAASREIFARGAVRAALWCRGRAPGLYSMRDVLGLS